MAGSYLQPVWQAIEGEGKGQKEHRSGVLGGEGERHECNLSHSFVVPSQDMHVVHTA